MTDRFPLLVGVTGKRKFSEDKQANARISQSVKERLAATFAWLDERFPGMPKVLLSGGALGTDLIAAQAALDGRPDWSVVLLLPYDQDLFEKDFDAGSPELEQFRALAAPGANPRVHVRTLPTLRTKARRVSTRADLDKTGKTHDKALRRGHYEQVGQFIAETAMILLAVMDPDTQPDMTQANGGTSRVVAYRRAGTHDEVGLGVRAASRLLPPPRNKLLLPPAGHVWLMDPRARNELVGLPVRVLPPLTDRPVEEVYGGYPGRDMPSRGSHRDILEHIWVRIADWAEDQKDILLGRPDSYMRGASRRNLRASLRLPIAFDRFRRLRGWIVDNGLPAGPLLAAIPDPAGEIARLRDPMGKVQQAIKRRAMASFWIVAAMFVLAVGMLEVFAKLAPQRPWMLAVYVLVLAGIGLLVSQVHQWRWHALSEDYRSVSEMLRVQRSWWAAGLPDRADEEHLQGADRELSGSRDAARSILNWVWLKSPWPTAEPPSTRWSVVIDPSWHGINGPRPTERLAKAPSGQGPRDWIGGQVSYFARNHEHREHQVQRSDTLTWFLFIGSGVMAAFLAVLLHSKPCLAWLLAEASGPCRGLVQAGALALVAAALAIRQALPHHEGMLRKVETWFFALLSALFLIVALAAFVAPDMPLAVNDLYGATSGLTERGEALVYTFKNLTIVTFVVLTALAGAIRFVTEKLGLEAEALAYRDALGKFEAAERILARNWDADAKAPRDIAAAQALVRELGIQALRENETWLRAHRERPLSPVIG